jgi:phosphoglycolate phosphatase
MIEIKINISSKDLRRKNMANNLVVFDLDGTLADTMDDLHTAISGMLTRLGYKTRTKQELLGFINNGAREFVRRSLPEDVQESELIIDTAVSVYDEEYEKCFADKTHLYDGIYDSLAQLKEETNCKFAVLSNKQDRFVKHIIAKLFPEKFFAIVQGQTAGVPTKPDPTSLLSICHLLRTKPENCTLVGDSDVDIKTAKNAEVKGIGVSWGYRDPSVLKAAGASVIAESPEQLYDYLLLKIRDDI